jgi:DNA-binding MarR family transcriptional regulator
MAPSKRTVSPAREAEALVERLGRVALRLSRGLRVEGAHLSTAALSALAAVAEAGSIRIGDLAAAEGVEAPTMSRLIDRLERDGLVRRRRDPSDSRAVEISGTARTLRALTAGRKDHSVRLASRLEQLPSRQRTELISALDVIEALVRTLDDI